MRWRRRRDWDLRVARMRALEVAPEPEQGHGPSWEVMITGRREFAGRVLGGPWAGHEVLVVSYGEARRRRAPRPEDFSFSADYWLVDWDEGGMGDGDADFSVETIDELKERLAEFPIQWYPPATSLARVGMLYGGSGKEQNLEKE